MQDQVVVVSRIRRAVRGECYIPCRSVLYTVYCIACYRWIRLVNE